MSDKARAEFDRKQESAISAFKDWYCYGDCPSELDVGMFEMARSAWLAAKEKYEPRGCAWSYDEDTDSYDTQCGGKFQTITDSIEDNGIDFCCYCGGEIQDTPSTQGGGE